MDLAMNKDYKNVSGSMVARMASLFCSFFKLLKTSSVEVWEGHDDNWW